MRMVRGTKYKKVKARGRGRFVGRVHLVFWYHDPEWDRKYWKFVCGKRQSAALEFDLDGAQPVDDSEPTTCMGCIKHAPDVVEYMDDIPSLDDFQ